MVLLLGILSYSLKSLGFKRDRAPFWLLPGCANIESALSFAYLWRTVQTPEKVGKDGLPSPLHPFSVCWHWGLPLGESHSSDPPLLARKGHLSRRMPPTPVSEACALRLLRPHIDCGKQVGTAMFAVNTPARSLSPGVEETGVRSCLVPAFGGGLSHIYWDLIVKGKSFIFSIFVPLSDWFMVQRQ